MSSCSIDPAAGSDFFGVHISNCKLELDAQRAHSSSVGLYKQHDLATVNYTFLSDCSSHKASENTADEAAKLRERTEGGTMGSIAFSLYIAEGWRIVMTIPEASLTGSLTGCLP